MGRLFGIISAIFIFLYCLLYLMRGLYVSTDCKSIRKVVNKVLPILTKYNPYFLICSLLLSIVHIILNCENGFSLSLGYPIIFLIIITLKNTYYKNSKPKNSYYLAFLAFMLFFSLLLHLAIKI